MPVKNPLLSLGAKGTIGDTLTFQKKQGVDYVRKKPIPAYRRTLPQNYQRWNYQDGIYYWKSLSDAQRKLYKATGARFHMTGFAYCMAYYLGSLPDLAGGWRLDEKAGAVATDFSKNENTGTVIGASPAAGLIDGCLSFDGLNDRVEIPTSPSLDITGNFTIEAFLTLKQLPVNFPTGARAIVDKTLAYRFWFHKATQKLRLILYSGGAVGYSGAKVDWVIDQWYHVAVSGDGTNIRFYVDGQLDNAPAQTNYPAISVTDLHIGMSAGVIYLHWGLLDHALLYTRALAPEQILSHSLRRYPV